MHVGLQIVSASNEVVVSITENTLLCTTPSFEALTVCDIVLFANAHGREIDWIRILQQCREIHADLFTAALFQIG